jgi:hypothetical protein
MCQKYSNETPSLHDPLRVWDGLAVPDWYYETDDDEEDEGGNSRQRPGLQRILIETALGTSGFLICSYLVKAFFRWI